MYAQNTPRMPIYGGGPGVKEHCRILILQIKSTPGCFLVGVDAELDVAPNHEPETGSEYPISATTRLDPNNPDAALAAVVTPTRITCQQNYQAFMIVLHSLTKPI